MRKRICVVLSVLTALCTGYLSAQKPGEVGYRFNIADFCYEILTPCADEYVSSRQATFGTVRVIGLTNAGRTKSVLKFGGDQENGDNPHYPYVVVGNTHYSYHVTEIGDKAFYKQHQIPEVVIDLNIQPLRRIGKGAFAECQNLQSVRMEWRSKDKPAPLEEIDDEAFFNCLSLHDIPLIRSNSDKSAPLSSLKRIGIYAFSRTPLGHDAHLNLASEYVPNLKKIGYKAFFHCELSSIVLPPSLETAYDILGANPLESITNDAPTAQQIPPPSCPSGRWDYTLKDGWTDPVSYMAEEKGEDGQWHISITVDVLTDMNYQDEFPTTFTLYLSTKTGDTSPECI